MYEINADGKEYPVCENYGDGKDHYKMGHRIVFSGDDGIHYLCTKCCDRAKANGAYIRAA